MERKKHIASVSWGKDSLAMLLLLLEKEYPLDEIMFFDTGKEFQAVYDVRDRAITTIQASHPDIKYVEIKAKPSFDYLMFEKPVCKHNTGTVHKYGYGWCGEKIRWGTSMKIHAIRRHTKGSLEYVGIAADETDRQKRQHRSNVTFPLAEWGMTEKACLEYCYERGYYWTEAGVKLYDVLDHVSCWCCKGKNKKELYNIYRYLPEYWQKLKDIQARLPHHPMKQFSNKKYGDYGNLFDLEKVFQEKIKGGEYEELENNDRRAID